jgi:hypothetical protein
MRKIIANAKVSLDGVMQGQGGPQEDTSEGFDLGGWSAQFSDAWVWWAPSTNPTTCCWGARPTTFLQAIGPMYRQTTPSGRSLQKANKYVLTRGSAKLDWANIHRMRNIDDVRKAKAGASPDIVLWAVQPFNPLSASVGSESHRPASTAHLSDSSWKRQKALRRHFAPCEHEAG